MPCSITVYIPPSVKSFISVLIGESSQGPNEWTLTFFNIPPPNVLLDPIFCISYLCSLYFLDCHWLDIGRTDHSSGASFKKMNELDGTGGVTTRVRYRKPKTKSFNQIADKTI